MELCYEKYVSFSFIVMLWSMGRFPTLNLFVFHTRIHHNFFHSFICLRTSSNLSDANASGENITYLNHHNNKSQVDGNCMPDNTATQHRTGEGAAEP
jgi:hypothetical protein